MTDKAIPRQQVPVNLTLSNGRSVAGTIQIDLDTRLSDFVNHPERFIVIRDNDGAIKIVNKDHIVDIRVK